MSATTPIPRTEAGMQQVLRQIAEARAAGDDAARAKALLELAYLVKWVRSDNDQSPFERSHALNLEALEIYRRLNDQRGIVSALIGAMPLAGRETAAKMMLEAEEIAGDLGDDMLTAALLAAKGRGLGVSYRSESVALTKRALALYEEAGSAAGMAQCHFSLAITCEDQAEKMGHGLSAARFYREIGDSHHAAKSVTLAFMWEKDKSRLAEYESVIKQGLEDAQASESRSSEASMYRFLAEIAEHRGNYDESMTYRLWEKDLRDSDGLTPEERRDQNVRMTRVMIDLAKKMGNPETVRMFTAELKRLKAKER